MSGQVLIAFGANIDPLNNLYHGLTHLHRAINLAGISTVWRTKPLPDPKWQGDDAEPGGSYLNGAVLSHIRIDPFVLKKILRKIESDCHRVRSPNRFAPRPLDLDIAMIGSEVINEPELTLPDPDILSRSFVVHPMAQLAPELIHPLENESLAQLAACFSLPDAGMVEDSDATDLLQSIIR